MELTFINFWQEVVRNPVLFITVVLTLGVIFVNGWTDAPNAIATCVRVKNVPSTRTAKRNTVWRNARR